jgi:hypothetical protein
VPIAAGPPRRLLITLKLGLLLLTLSLLLTTACSPAPTTITPPGTLPVEVTITAVFLDAGVPTVIVHQCPGSLVDSITVTDLSVATSPGSTPGDLNIPIWSVADPGAKNPTSQIRLLQTPAGWQVGPAIKNLITEFYPGHLYWVIASTTTDPASGVDAGVKFRLSDLALLTDGQVWAAATPGHARATTRDQFFHDAAIRC